MQNGDYAVHIASELVLAMDGELEEITKLDSPRIDQSLENDESSSPYVYFGTESDQVLLLESLTKGMEKYQDMDLELNEEELMTHHLQSSLTKQPITNDGSPSSDF